MAIMETTNFPKVRSMGLPLLIGTLMMMVGMGAAGFFLAYKGFLPNRFSIAMNNTLDEKFIALDPLIISIGSDTSHHLRFSAQLAVPSNHIKEVEALKPRIQDVLNSYLRALDPEDISDPGALIRLRAQIVRRIRLVTGEQAVNDLLISEFVLS